MSNPFVPNLQNIINTKPLELGTSHFDTMATTPCVSHDTCHMSCVACHVSRVSRGPQSLSRWDLNPGQNKISRTNIDENHVLKSKNHAENDQEECLIKTQIERQKKNSFTDTNYL